MLPHGGEATFTHFKARNYESKDNIRMQIQVTQHCLQPSHYHSSAWLFYVGISVFSTIKSYTKIFLITPEYNCPMQMAQRAFNLL